MTTEGELRAVFIKSFDRLKKTFYRNYSIEEREDDTPPHVLSLRDAIESLPPSAQVIEITGPPEHQFLKNGKGFLFKYDFDHLKSDHFEFSGTIDHKNPGELAAVLIEKFKIDEKEVKEYAYSLCKDFNITGRWSPPHTWYLHFVSDDIVKNPDAYYDDLLFHFLVSPGGMPIISEKFQRREHPDYNRIFNLPSDDVWTVEQLTKPDGTSQTLKLNPQQLQERVSNIQLIPNVPEGARRAFDLAKELFIFGYFRYGFFTIAQHYAFLALEAAIKARYIASLGNVAVLTDSRKKDLRYEIRKPRYHLIEEFCRAGQQKGWNKYKLLVNGEPFPHNGKKLVQWLVDKHIIRKWEMGRYDAGLQIRNSLSHLESVTIQSPHASLLERVAEQINFLFYPLQNNEIKDSQNVNK